MKVFYSESHNLHSPQFFLVRGRPQRSAEQPERAITLLSALRRLEVEVSAPEDFGVGPCMAIHTPDYLEFLATAYERWQVLGDASTDVVPNTHPVIGEPVTYPNNIVGRAGFHIADMASPIGQGTWLAAVRATHSACQAAQSLVDGERAAYALCRPPGHHAYADKGGGFCFLNNSAIAAQFLLRRFNRVAILDVDVHHGNGTQSIFYRRRDVLTVSLHADPSGFYPFFVGYSHERGDGEGLGYNLNIPLPHGTADAGYLEALRNAGRHIGAFAPGGLVVALGLDAFEGDPFKGLAITTPGFAAIGAEIARLGLPTVFVQEGGYLSPELGENLASVLTGFRREA